MTDPSPARRKAAAKRKAKAEQSTPASDGRRDDPRPKRDTMQNRPAQKR